MNSASGTALVHPRQALFGVAEPALALAACEHYAGSQRLLDKALALQRDMGPVFDITADCEDGAAAGQEAEQARMVARLLQSPDNRFDRLGVRIHDPSHPSWRDDVRRIVGEAAQRLAYVTIPKAHSEHEVREVAETVQDTARAAGRASALAVHVLIETHGALRRVWEIAALPYVETLDFGIMDWVSAHRGAIGAQAMHSPGQFEHHLVVRAKAECVAAAVAHGRMAAHNVCTELRDPEVVRSDALRARHEFGFQRMWSIHPMQIAPIVEAMRPDFDEVELAAEVLLAAQAVQWGPIQHAGRLHDRASYRYYWSLLERARATGQALPQAALQGFFRTP
jgi:citrate lyase subunit beta/citryl-CoA lyase